MTERLARLRRLAAALALAGAPAVATALAAAEDHTALERREHDHDRAEQARERGEIRPLEEIMAIVSRRVPGEIARVELERHGGIWIYELKVIDPAGRLVEVRIEAATGRELKADGEDD